MSTLPQGWQDIRRGVLLLDGYTCRYCIRPAEVVTRNNPAGPYVPANLLSLCRGCLPHHKHNQTGPDRHTREQMTKPVERPRRLVINPPGT